MFKTVLTSFIHPEHEFCLLAKKIDWEGLEKEFAHLDGKVGSPSVPIRTIVGLLPMIVKTNHLCKFLLANYK